MTLLEDLILIVLQNSPAIPGRDAPPLYGLLNLLLPLVFGAVLAWVTHRLEKILLRLIREKR